MLTHIAISVNERETRSHRVDAPSKGWTKMTRGGKRGKGSVK